MLVEPFLVDIESGVEVVEVGHFRDVGHPLVGLLEAGDGDGHIASRCEEVAVLVLQVLIFDVQQQFVVVPA